MSTPRPQMLMGNPVSCIGILFLLVAAIECFQLPATMKNLLAPHRRHNGVQPRGLTSLECSEGPFVVDRRAWLRNAALQTMAPLIFTSTAISAEGALILIPPTGRPRNIVITGANSGNRVTEIDPHVEGECTHPHMNQALARMRQES